MTPLLKLLVCGGRDFSDRDRAFAVLDEIAAKALGPFVVIEGGAKGADFWARAWADERGHPHAQVRANWNRYGPGAGTKRNEWMLGLVPDLVVAFPGGRGTAHMVQIARAAGVQVREVQA